MSILLDPFSAGHCNPGRQREIERSCDCHMMVTWHVYLQLQGPGIQHRWNANNLLPPVFCERERERGGGGGWGGGWEGISNSLVVGHTLNRPQTVAVGRHLLQRDICQSVTVADGQTLQLRTAFTDSLNPSITHSLSQEKFEFQKVQN